MLRPPNLNMEGRQETDGLPHPPPHWRNKAPLRRQAKRRRKRFKISKQIANLHENILMREK